MAHDQPSPSIAPRSAVVLLSGTALVNFGGLRTLALHLLDPSLFAGAPRIAATADAKLIDALVGRYRLPSGLGIGLRHKGNAGDPGRHAARLRNGYDSARDIYPLAFDALLRPKRMADGTYTFTWFQLGGAFEAARTTPAADKWTPTEEQLKEYEVTIRFGQPNALRVFSTDAKLFVQGQPRARGYARRKWTSSSSNPSASRLASSARRR